MAAAVVSVFVLCIVLLPVLVIGCRGRSGRLLFGRLAIWLAVAVAGVVLATKYSAPAHVQVVNRPIEVRGEGYVSSRTCRACHPAQYAAWYASYHRRMTQVANPHSVLGDFQDVRLTWKSQTYLLQQRDGQFFVEMDAVTDVRPRESDLIVRREVSDGGAGGQVRRVSRPVVMTTGSHHYQVYWLPTGRGRKVESLPFVYLLEDRRWIPRDAAFLKPPHVAEGEQPGRWNLDCNRCHATHGRPRIDQPHRLELAEADTVVAELGIACEACHGPGQRHVAAHRDPRRRYRQHLSDQPDDWIIHPVRLSPRRASQVCAHCHSINAFYRQEDADNWLVHGFRYRPGDDLEQVRHVVRPNDDRNVTERELIRRMDPNFMADHYWSDGMVRVSGREYNGLIESGCHQRGDLSCLSCHVMHKLPDDPRPLVEWANDQLKPAMEGNRACLECHPMSTQDISEHTHHAASSAGSICYNCHMPYTTYGLLKAIRSHQIDSPRVDVTLQTGRPNACNLCHLDQTLDWTADYLARWYGQPKPKLGHDEQTIAASLLWLLRGDAGQRALMAWSMGWPPARQVSGWQWIPPFLAQLLDDPYDAVRFIAHRSLCEFPGFVNKGFSYDFVGSPQTRQAAVGQVMELWEGIERNVQADRWDRVLIDPAGKVRRSELDRLLGERSDRRVHLKE